MRSDILRSILAEYAQKQESNAQAEQKRREAAEAGCSGLTDLLSQRSSLIFDSINGILSGAAAADDLPARMQDLNTRIAACLRAGGFPETQLDPVYTCPLCHDTGYVGEPVREFCSCVKAEYNRRLTGGFRLAGTESQTFETFDETIFPNDRPLPGKPFTQRQYMVMLREELKEIADTWPEGNIRTVTLYGKSGLGKTFLLQAMHSRLLERNVNALSVSAYRYLEAARRVWFGGEDEELTSLQKADVLLVDDLGSEPLMQNITVEQFYTLIDERQRAGLCTVFSTNLNLDELKKRYTERIVSRLTDKRHSMTYEFLGEDVRNA